MFWVRTDPLDRVRTLWLSGRRSDVRLTQLAILGLFVAMLGLTACGRAGPLEPPPDYEKSEDDTFILDPLIDPPLPAE